MVLFKKKKKKRVCVIGLDGVPFTLLSDLSQNGTMPSMNRLINSGHLHRMKASLPEISAVSWTDFMTGSDSGTHGIFGFTDLKKNSYDLRFPNFLDVKKETFWDILGHQNKKCIIINQPSTYPARKIDGILISGFVAIDLAKAVYPLSLKPSLERMDYKIDIDTLKCREDHEFLWKELAKILIGRQKALDFLWKEAWDYFEFVFTGTDRVHHFLWDAYKDENHIHHQNFLEYYHHIDQIIDKIATSFQKLTGSYEGLYFLSDHGFTAIEQEVYLNAWLEKGGYLKFTTTSPKDLNDMSPSTQAFAMDPNRIYLNLKGKYPKGGVKDSERESLKNEIKTKLEKLKYKGKKVIRKVFYVHEIYSGPYVSMGPDLIAVSEDGFDLKGSVKKKEIFSRSNLQGMHTWENAFFWANKEKGPELRISDLASIIMDDFQ